MTVGSVGDSSDQGRSQNNIAAARAATARALQFVHEASGTDQLLTEQREQLLRDLSAITQALAPDDTVGRDPYAFAMAAPQDRRRNSLLGFDRSPTEQEQPEQSAGGGEIADQPARPAATEAIAGRAGALLDEVDFPSFVASLVHGTFDAVVDASIRQLEAFADLVSSVAKTSDQFASENVTENQARDWLVDRYPADLELLVPGDGVVRPTLRPRMNVDGESPSPPWLSEFGLQDEELSAELIEKQLIPQARKSLANDRLQTLATMVLLGMNRIVVSDGSITAKLKFRAAARDRSEVDFAVTQDPEAGEWGTRGSANYATHSTMVSTVGVNAQSDAQLRADLFGEVRLNFVSETLPLDQFADSAQRSLLQRNARWTPDQAPVNSSSIQTTPPALPSVEPVAPALPAPAPEAPAPAPSAPAPTPAPVPAPAPAPPDPAAGGTTDAPGGVQ